VKFPPLVFHGQTPAYSIKRFLNQMRQVTVAQLVERSTADPKVKGSNPAAARQKTAEKTTEKTAEKKAWKALK
jgi:hypothetical protein